MGRPSTSATNAANTFSASRLLTPATVLLRYRFRPGHPIEGQVISNEGRFQDIVPGQRIVTAQTMMLQDKRLFSALVTMEFVADGDGTNLICTNQGAFYEAAGPDFPKMIEQGWRGLLQAVEKVLAG